jgi:hypothetical protein
MVSSGMLRRGVLARTDVSEELSASFIRVTRIGELGTTLALTCTRRPLYISSPRASFAINNKVCTYFTDSCHPDEGDAKFLQNVSSYKSHTA